MVFDSTLKTNLLERRAEKALFYKAPDERGNATVRTGRQVRVLGGGKPTNGRVVSFEVKQRRVFIVVELPLGQFTFPAEAIELR